MQHATSNRFPPLRHDFSHPTEAELSIPVSEYVALTKNTSSSTFSFLRGLLLGQLSVILVLLFFIKFFIFGPSPRGHLHHSPPPTARQNLRKKASSILRNPPPSSLPVILSKTYYNVVSHQPESLDWFNVLLAQALAQFREDARTDDAILKTLDKVLNGGTKPEFLGPIKITEVNLGEEFPIFSNCRVVVADDGGIREGKLVAQMDVDLSDVITLGVETKVYVNWPTPKVAVLPIALAVTVQRFSGTLSISFLPGGRNTDSPQNGDAEERGSTALAFSFGEDYRLDVSVRSLVGSRTRLQDVPKIERLVESRLHCWLDERCVAPRFQQVVLPSLWPRRKRTHEHERDGEDGETRRRRDSRAQEERYESSTGVAGWVP